MPPSSALPSLRGKGGEEIGLAPVVVERQRGRDAMSREILAHPVDQREIRVAARRVERDQRADQRPSDKLRRQVLAVPHRFDRGRGIHRGLLALAINASAQGRRQDRERACDCQMRGEDPAKECRCGVASCRTRSKAPCSSPRSSQPRPAWSEACPDRCRSTRSSCRRDSRSKSPPGCPTRARWRFAADGTLFVGSTGAGKVYAVSFPPAGTREGVIVRVIASGLPEPAGVAFRDGALYVSAIDRILRFDDIERHLEDPPKPVVATEELPADRHHGLKYIAFGPDGKLYVNVGAPCNICEPDRDRYAVILRMNADGSGREVYREGRAQLGRVRLGSANQGPMVHDQRPRLARRRFSARHAEPRGEAGSRFRVSLLSRRHDSRPRVREEARLQRVRATGATTRPARRSAGDALLHGHAVPGRLSQSDLHCRARLVEPHAQDRLSRHAREAGPGGQRRQLRTLRDGWLKGEQAWGRPVDVLVAPDGSLLVSDDSAGAIYRIRYRGSQ